MEKNEIIRELKALIEENNLNKTQRKMIERMIADAHPVKCVRAADVLDDYQLEYVREVIKPAPRQCFKNAALLTDAFPEIEYVECKVGVPFTIDHAINKVGDSYIDITFEFALNENPREFNYVAMGAYDAKQLRALLAQHGFYGEYYRMQIYKEITEAEKGA